MLYNYIHIFLSIHHTNWHWTFVSFKCIYPVTWPTYRLWPQCLLALSVYSPHCVGRAALSVQMGAERGWLYYMVHYSDVIMNAMASQISSLTIVYSTVYPGTDERQHQSFASLALCAGNSPHNGPVTRKMFPFYDIIMASIPSCPACRPLWPHCLLGLSGHLTLFWASSALCKSESRSRLVVLRGSADIIIHGIHSTSRELRTPF